MLLLNGLLVLVADAVAARDALDRGARGVLLTEDVDEERVAAAMKAIEHGFVVMDAEVAADLLDHGPAPAPANDVFEPLPPRETEVLEQMSGGYSNREIGERLGVSRHTAKFHVHSILEKLGAETRTEAVMLAARGGLLEL
ncbi:MAG: response regulator transcription factor [Proteobacteria bacterium]|nr:response regulator transcription factor [Pseudomonadota bacterium]